MDVNSISKSLLYALRSYERTGASPGAANRVIAANGGATTDTVSFSQEALRLAGTAPMASWDPVSVVEWVKVLFPNPARERGSFIDLLPRPSGDVQDVSGLLRNIYRLESRLLTFQFQMPDEEESSREDYSMYLQFPNWKIRELARQIVSPGDSNDVKAQKVTQWVIENVEYKTDSANYGQSEYWALPTVTINRKSGDCEDGAFLIHSLLLNAGVPPERLRTYGGLVVADVGASGGGHGWTAYARETDDEWVVLDFSYYPSSESVADRIPMREDDRYIDDYFYVSVGSTVETPYSNRVRYPTGLLVNTYA